MEPTEIRGTIAGTPVDLNKQDPGAVVVTGQAVSGSSLTATSNPFKNLGNVTQRVTLSEGSHTNATVQNFGFGASFAKTVDIPPSGEASYLVEYTVADIGTTAGTPDASYTVRINRVWSQV